MSENLVMIQNIRRIATCTKDSLTHRQNHKLEKIFNSKHWKKIKVK